MKIRKNTGGFTLVEIMIVVAIIGLLAAIAVPNFVQARTNARTNACINNLRLIDAAKEQFGMQNNISGATVITALQAQNFLRNQTMPVCPAGTAAYADSALGVNPICPNVTANPTHVLV